MVFSGSRTGPLFLRLHASAPPCVIMEEELVMPGTRVSIITALCAIAAWAQPESKTFYFPDAQAPAALQEYLNSIRSISDIGDAASNWEKKSITVSGSSEQISMAAWLAQQFAEPPASRAATIVRDYPGTAGKTDVVKI